MNKEMTVVTILGWIAGVIIILFYAATALAEPTIDMEKIKQIESHGDPRAFNERTQARGLYQIRKIAWKDVQQHYPKLKKYDYLTYAYNPKVSTIFAKKYFTILEKYLKHYGIPITTKHLLIAYHDGIGNLIKYREGKRELGLEMKGYLKKYILLDR